MEELSIHQWDATMLIPLLLSVSLCARTHAPIYVYLIKREIKEWTTISLGLKERGSSD